MGWNSNNPNDAPVGDTRTQLVRRGLLAAMAVGLALALVTSGTPTVGADGKGPKACSNRTLRGDYGFDISGTIILPSPAPSFLLRGLAMSSTRIIRERRRFTSMTEARPSTCVSSSSMAAGRSLPSWKASRRAARGSRSASESSCADKYEMT
jgi:hypothetical protein